jgi:Na+-transporting NADH:ubiquinone oxidoreductase subunit NqrF
MIKSFTESGGTALSTDWSSVGKGELRAGRRLRCR